MLARKSFWPQINADFQDIDSFVFTAEIAENAEITIVALTIFLCGLCVLSGKKAFLRTSAKICGLIDFYRPYLLRRWRKERKLL